MNTIDLRHLVTNKSRNFGSDVTYIPAYLIGFDGKRTPLLLTHGQLRVAEMRAAVNKEDVPPFVDSEKCSFKKWLTDLFK